ncbi:MAG: hypothetical protein ACP5IZ_12045, partial [Thermoprotei archaeon]
WVKNDPYVMIVEHNKAMEDSPICKPEAFNDYYLNDRGQIRSEIQHPTLNDDPIGIQRQYIQYYKYVDNGNGTITIRKYVIWITPADFIIEIGTPSGTGWYNWRGSNIWYVLDSVSWLNSYSSKPPDDPDPLTNSTVKYLSSNYRGAYPLIAWIQGYQDWKWIDDKGNIRTTPPDDNAKSHVQLDPSY